MYTTTTLAPTAAYGTLLLRVCLGFVYLGHAILIKFFVLGIPRTIAWFESMGYPEGLLYVVMLIEIVAGVLLVLGVYARWVALTVIPISVGAMWMHMNSGSVLRGGEAAWEYTMLLTALSLVLFLLGDGAYALRSSLAPPPSGAQPQSSPEGSTD